MKKSKQVLMAVLLLSVELAFFPIEDSLAQTVDSSSESPQSEPPTIDLQIDAPASQPPSRATLYRQLRIHRYSLIAHSINIQQQQLKNRSACSSTTNSAISTASPPPFVSSDSLSGDPLPGSSNNQGTNQGIDILGLLLALPQMIQADCFRNAK